MQNNLYYTFWVWALGCCRIKLNSCLNVVLSQLLIYRITFFLSITECLYNKPKKTLVCPKLTRVRHSILVLINSTAFKNNSEIFVLTFYPLDTATQS